MGESSSWAGGNLHIKMFGLMLWLLASGVSSLAQVSDSVESAPSIVTGHPFSARKYSRTVRIRKDGTRVILSEKGHTLIARDADGRVFMRGEDDRCDPPGLGKLPVCDVWCLDLFDPNQGVSWQWLDGEYGEKSQYVEVAQPRDRVDRGKSLTSDTPPFPSDITESGTTYQDLGERTFEGIRAKGVRTTTRGKNAAGQPNVTIHEVWISAEMHLVLRVIDGDPAGEETSSGLDHISLSPDPRLFEPPRERILRHYEGKFGDGHIDDFEAWFVR